MKVGIVGYGWVGKAMRELFPDAYLYDPYATEYSFATLNTKEGINSCDITFIGVPTPSLHDNYQFAADHLDTSIVEEVISWCKSDLIVVRSTVNPGDCDRWTSQYNKNIVMQPEYLGETPAHPLLDPKIRPFLVIGGHPEDRRKLIELYTTVYNANTNIRQVTNLEAEIIKLSENRAIAWKVAQHQELFDVCEAAHIDYYAIREAVYSDDPRFNLWWSFIFPDARGMNSKCIPKDVYAWAAWAESVGYDPKITRAILEKNTEWVK